MNRRLIRLYNDYNEVQKLIENHPHIEIKEVMGDPPERYLINYKIKGLVQNGNEIIEKDSHLIEIILSGDYPRHEPICRFISIVVFHPNVAPNKICIADHWAAGESLTDIIVRIGEMICYQNYNIKSPLNGEAAKWAEENITRFPIDDVYLEPIRQFNDDIPEIHSLINTNDFQKQNNNQAFKENLNCANCGSGGTGVSILECSNGHIICSDCVINCSTCSKILCVLCQLEKCSYCGRIQCQECLYRCQECHSYICNEHIHSCVKCGSVLCNKCSSICSMCSAVLCDFHKLEHYENHKHDQLIHRAEIQQSFINVQNLPNEANSKEVKLNASCLNCGAESTKISVLECSNGHIVCTDCTLECGECFKKLCVLCSFERCSTCKKILCKECQGKCQKCNSFICKEHMYRCSVCGKVLCKNCVATCSKCAALFCDIHIYEHEQNHKYGPSPDDQKVKISIEEVALQEEPIQTSKNNLSLRFEPIICSYCRHVVEEPEANFCTMCGSRIKK